MSVREFSQSLYKTKSSFFFLFAGTMCYSFFFFYFFLSCCIYICHLVTSLKKKVWCCILLGRVVELKITCNSKIIKVNVCCLCASMYTMTTLMIILAIMHGQHHSVNSFTYTPSSCPPRDTKYLSFGEKASASTFTLCNGSSVCFMVPLSKSHKMTSALNPM